MKLRLHRSLAALLLCSTAALTQGEKKISVTISPIHLALPVVELTGEYALSPKAGLAVIGGYGNVTVEGTTENFDFPVLELGTQFSYYALGSFRHGMQVGVELLWIKAFPPEQSGVTFSANGAAFGPLIGYKWISRIGFTLFIQGGYEFMFAQAKAKDATGQEIESSVEDGIPLVNINLGWSF